MNDFEGRDIPQAAKFYCVPHGTNPNWQAHSNHNQLMSPKVLTYKSPKVNPKLFWQITTGNSEALFNAEIFILLSPFFYWKYHHQFSFGISILFLGNKSWNFSGHITLKTVLQFCSSLDRCHVIACRRWEDYLISLSHLCSGSQWDALDFQNYQWEGLQWAIITDFWGE